MVVSHGPTLYSKRVCKRATWWVCLQQSIEYIYPPCNRQCPPPPIYKRASATVFLDVWVSVTVRVGALRGFGLVL